MSRKHQIVLDFKRLLKDCRLSLTNVGYMDDKKPNASVYFDVLFCGEWLDCVRLDQDYSNIIEMAARILKAHPTQGKGKCAESSPLIRLRVSTLSGKRHCTLGVARSFNLEFYGVHNRRVSDQLADAILNDTEHLSLAASYSDAFISHAKYSNEAHYTFKLEQSK